MIKVAKETHIQRPYADVEHIYSIKAEGMTREEVEQYCKEHVYRACYSKADADRAWYDAYYTLCEHGNNEYTYTVIVPNCD